ncbi:hypothetical protein Dimus_014760 [Dionaea muscipula]
MLLLSMIFSSSQSQMVSHRLPASDQNFSYSNEPSDYVMETDFRIRYHVNIMSAYAFVFREDRLFSCMFMFDEMFILPSSWALEVFAPRPFWGPAWRAELLVQQAVEGQ